MNILSIIGLIIKNWQYILFGAAFFAAGVYLAWHIQGIKIDRLKAEGLRLKAELKQCVSANESAQKTISSLQSEIKKANKLCKARLDIKEKVIKRIQEIDTLNPEQEGENNEKNTGDRILFKLNRMFR